MRKHLYSHVTGPTAFLKFFIKKKIKKNYSVSELGWMGRQEKIGSEKKAREKGHIQTKCIKETFLAASKHT